MNFSFTRRKNKVFSLLLFSLVLIFIFFSFFCSAPLVSMAKETENVSLIYKIRLHKIRDDVALHIKQGDSIIEAVGKYNIGEVLEVRYERSCAEVFSHHENKNVISEYEGYCDIVLTVSSSASKSERGYVVNGYLLRLSKEIALRLPDFYGVGKCVSVTRAEGRL